MASYSVFWKKDDAVVLFGSWFGEKFADNPRYLFQYLHKNKEKYALKHVVWVTSKPELCDELKSMGYEIYLMDSQESIEYHKKAKYHLICNAMNKVYLNDNGRKYYRNPDINTDYSWRAKKINLDHGVLPFKGVGSASLESKRSHGNSVLKISRFLKQNFLYRKFAIYNGGWGDCYIVYNTIENLKTRKLYYDLPEECFFEDGYPRLNIADPELTKDEKKVLELMDQYKKVILYLPTFRTGTSTFDFNEASVGLSEYLEKNNILWIQKAHSAANIEISQTEKNDNILTLPSDFDTNTIIPLITLMVSDYSSVIGDAIAYYKPLVFYIPDFDEYKNGERGFVRDPEEMMCGPTAKTISELKEVLEQVLNTDFKPDEKYLNLREKYIGRSWSMHEIWTRILEK